MLPGAVHRHRLISALVCPSGLGSGDLVAVSSRWRKVFGFPALQAFRKTPVSLTVALDEGRPWSLLVGRCGRSGVIPGSLWGHPLCQATWL